MLRPSGRSGVECSTMPLSIIAEASNSLACISEIYRAEQSTISGGCGAGGRSLLSWESCDRFLASCDSTSMCFTKLLCLCVPFCCCRFWGLASLALGDFALVTSAGSAIRVWSFTEVASSCFFPFRVWLRFLALALLVLLPRPSFKLMEFIVSSLPGDTCLDENLSESASNFCVKCSLICLMYSNYSKFMLLLDL